MAGSASRSLPVRACVIALVLMGGAQAGLRVWPDAAAPTVLFLLAGAALAWLLPAPRAPVTGGRAGPGPAPERGRGWLLLSGGAAALAGGSALLAFDWARFLGRGVGCLLLGVTLVSLGLRTRDAARPRRPRPAPWEWAGLAVALALGAWLRFHDYAAFPPPFGTHAIEEQQTGLTGAQILEGLRPWEFPLDTYVTALALHWSAAPTFTTIRIPFTIASLLTVLPAFALLRQLVRAPAALAATFLFAVSSWNLLYSRVAHNIFMPNLFVVTAFALLVDFVRTRRLAPVPWLGLLCGYTLYVYAGYRATTLLVLGGLAGCLAADLRRRGRGRAGAAPARGVAAVAVFLGVVAAAAVPLYVQLRRDTAQPLYYFEAASRSLANRAYYTSDPAAFVGQRLGRIRDAAAIFMHRGDGSLTFNDPGRPMLDPVTATCFVGGLALALRHLRRGLHAYWIAVLLALMFLLTVFVQNLDVRRLQGITILVAVFAGLFLDSLRELVGRFRRPGRVAAGLCAGIAAAGVVWWSHDVYFRGMARNPRVREAFKNHYTVLIGYGRSRYAQEGGMTREFLVLSPVRRFFDPAYYYGSHYHWLHRGFMAGRDLGDLSEVLPPRPLPAAGRPLSVIVQEPFERAAAAALLAAVYPGTRCEDVADPDIPRAAFVVCDLPAAPVARPLYPALHARYWRPGDEPDRPAVEREEPFLGLAFVPPACREGDGAGRCGAEWSGSVEVGAGGPRTLAVEVREHAEAELHVDGTAAGAKARLEAGVHDLRVEATLPQGPESGVRLVWQAEGRAPEVVPFFRLGAAAGGQAGGNGQSWIWEPISTTWLAGKP